MKRWAGEGRGGSRGRGWGGVGWGGVEVAEMMRAFLWCVCKFQTLVYDTLPPTTAITGYATDLGKLPANGQFFFGVQMEEGAGKRCSESNICFTDTPAMTMMISDVTRACDTGVERKRTACGGLDTLALLSFFLPSFAARTDLPLPNHPSICRLPDTPLCHLN